MDSVGFHDWGSCGSQFYCIEDSRDRLPLPLSDEPGEPGGPEPAVDGGAGAAAGSVDLAPFADVAAAPVDSVDVDEGVLTILVLGSDAGGDEKKSRRQVHADTREQPRTLVFDGDCLAHQYHLIVQSEQALMNDFMQER
ncbi:unnamed protein product, partial [Prorocentrum cordatum]